MWRRLAGTSGGDRGTTWAVDCPSNYAVSTQRDLSVTGQFEIWLHIQVRRRFWRILSTDDDRRRKACVLCKIGARLSNGQARKKKPFVLALDLRAGS